jgi:cytochrome c
LARFSSWYVNCIEAHLAIGTLATTMPMIAVSEDHVKASAMI